jgi:hypothetical protein
MKLVRKPTKENVGRWENQTSDVFGDLGEIPNAGTRIIMWKYNQKISSGTEETRAKTQTAQNSNGIYSPRANDFRKSRGG